MSDNTDNLYTLSDEELLTYSPEQAEQDAPTDVVDKPEEHSQETQDNTASGIQEANVDEPNTANGYVSNNVEYANDGNETSEQSGEVDYKAFYEQVTAKIKANGKEMQVSDPRDIIALMQQGANYSKVMRDLKPTKQLARMLEKHGLTDTEKLSYLIDLYEKKPQAIAKLIKDADFDMYSAEYDDADEYVPTNRAVEISPVEEVLQNLQETSEHYSTLINNINTWDDKSKEIIVENPQLLNIFNAQMEHGIFQQIVDTIERERMFGRLTNETFLDAYRIVEQSFVNTENQQTNQPQSFTGTRPQNSPSANNVAQKARASTPNTGGKAGSQKALSDAELYKLSDDDLLKYLASQG